MRVARDSVGFRQRFFSGENFTEMDTSTNGVSGNGPTKSVHGKPRVNVFDLVKVGMSTVLALAVFIGIGHVVKHVAGPSAILSILIATLIAYFVGKIKILK